MVVSIEQNVDNAQSLTAQCIGILGAGGSQTAAEGCADIVQLVGNAYDAANVALGQLVAGKAGQVMLKNALSHSRCFAIQLSIFAAHNALQLSEFYNHAGNKVAFAQQSGALQLRLINLSIDSHSQHVSSLHQTVALVVHIAQAFLEGNGFQFFQAVSQALLAVLVKEEFSVAQTCTQYALVTMRHNLQMVLATVAHGDEFVQQGAILGHNREIALVVAHRGDDAFLGQSQEFIFKLAAQSGGPFYEVVYFLQQILVDFYMAALGNTQINYLLTNQLTASVLVHHNEIII